MATQNMSVVIGVEHNENEVELMERKDSSHKLGSFLFFCYLYPLIRIATHFTKSSRKAL